MSANQNDPNSNPQGKQESSELETSVQELRQQADLASQLNNSLVEVDANLEKITGFTRTQSDLFVSLIDSFEKIHDAVEEMAKSSTIITENIEKAALIVLDKISEKNFMSINKSLTEVASSAMNGITTQTQAFKDLSSESESFQATNQNLTQQMVDNAGDLANQQSQSQKEADALKENAEKLNEGFEDLSDQAKKTTEQIENLKSGFGGTIKSLLSGVTGAIGSLFNAMSTLVGAAKNFVAFSLSIPFTITQEAAKLGNTIRTDLVEVIQSSIEAAKDKFDLSSRVGKAISNMGERGKKMLMDFQDPASEMVKLFGEGAAGIAARNSQMIESISSMGHFSEIFGSSLMNNEQNLVRFTKLTRAFGFSGEDLKFLALDAANNLMHVNDRMEILGETITSISKEYNIDRKRLGKNVMAMRKDIISFGHLSDEEITQTAAKITHMKVKLEDAAAVFSKFSTFEDAANSVAMLSQTFGMNLNAMDLIQAKNPEEIFTMFRESMMQTGRSFEDLNRHEKELMAQHTGMSSESLKALMSYRDLGYSYQEAVDKMNAEKPEAKQMEALKGLNSSIKQIQKILQFNSPFAAFADGLANNITLTGSLKDTMTSLSSGYESIYRYAKGLNPKVWRGIVEPIQMILDVMTMIFSSKGFKKGLVGSLKAISNFVARVFGVTSEDVILENLRGNVVSILDNKKIEPKIKEKFNKEVGEKMSFALQNYTSDLSKYIPDLSTMIKDNDFIGIIDALQQIKAKSGVPKEIKASVGKLSRELAEGFSTVGVKTKSGKEEKVYKSIAGQFAEDVKRNLEYNTDNAKKLGSLTSNVMGAIIMGAGSGFVAFLRVLNDGIDKATGFMGDGKDKQVNQLAKFLQVDKSRLVELGTNLNQAVRGLFDRKGKLFNIASWIVGGFGDMFEILIDMFLHVLAGGIEGIFGKDLFTYEPSARQQLSISKFDEKKQKEGGQNVLQSMQKGEPIKGKDAAASTHLAEAKIRSVKDKDQRTMLYAALEKSREQFIDSDGGAGASKKLAFSTMSMMQDIKDGKYLGKTINRNIGGKEVKEISGDIISDAKLFTENISNILSSYLDNAINLKGEDEKYKYKIKALPDSSFTYENARALLDMQSKFGASELKNLGDHVKKFSYTEEEKGNFYRTQRYENALKHLKGFPLFNKNTGLSNDFMSLVKTLSISPLIGESIKYKNQFQRKKLNISPRSAPVQSLSDSLTTTVSSKKSLTNSTKSLTPPTPNTLPATPTSTPIAASTPTAPIATGPAVNPGSSNSKAKKEQIEIQKQQLKEVKNKAQQSKTVIGKNIALTNEQYVMFSKKLLKFGNLISHAKNPEHAGVCYLPPEATVSRSGDNSDHSAASPTIKTQPQVMNTSAQ